ncbi:Arm DNA-binding domain-containing protein [Nocardia sp. 2YAB30]|uniref:Arm DNA-binding domain-containing protein n=1 Tax=unclassified Nocardia TaxID=2637762 RepID=UPI003F9B8FF4
MCAMTKPKRQQLPPQIEKITLKSGAVRYEVCAEVGTDETGRRRQTRKRYNTEKEARDALAAVNHAVAQGTYVARSTVTSSRLAPSGSQANESVSRPGRRPRTHSSRSATDSARCRYNSCRKQISTIW